MKNKRVAVVMCTWQRIDKLNRTISCLEAQSYKNFDFFIWNNNPKIINQIKKHIEKTKININVYNSNKNIGGLGRFKYTQKIRNNYGKVIFIDDDQIFESNFIEHMVSIHKKRTIMSWFSWKINGTYFNRVRVKDFKEADYCGTGGMICDTSIFTNDFFRHLPDKYSFIEDLYLSYYAKYKLRFKLIGVDAPIKIEIDNKDQYIKLKNKKNEFLNYLKKNFIKKQIDKKFLIIGHPRCGTGYSAKLMQSYGFDVGHEVMGKHGISSWFLAFPNDTRHKIPKPNLINYEHMITNVRNPIDAINSIVFTETPHMVENRKEKVTHAFDFRAKYVDINDKQPAIVSAIKSYLGWYKMIEDYYEPDHVLYVDKENTIEDFFKKNEISFKLKTQGLPPTNYNSRSHQTLTKRDWETCPENLFIELDDFSIKHGYGSLLSQIKHL